MAKQVIILDTNEKGRLRAAFWLDVPAARRPFYANASTSSAYKDATGPELADLQSGAVVEQVAVFVVAGMTNTQIRSMLQAEFTARQSAVNAHNPWSRYGTFHDGTTWTAGGAS